MLVDAECSTNGSMKHMRERSKDIAAAAAANTINVASATKAVEDGRRMVDKWSWQLYHCFRFELYLKTPKISPIFKNVVYS